MSRGFFGERFSSVSHSVKCRTHDILPNSIISSRIQGAELLQGSAVPLNASGLPALNQGIPLASLASFVEKASQSVSQLRAAALPLMSAAWPACRQAPGSWAVHALPSLQSQLVLTSFGSFVQHYLCDFLWFFLGFQKRNRSLA